MTRRLVPAALVAAIAALLAFAALRPADSPGRLIPASVVSETTPVDYNDGPPISNAQIDREIERTQACRQFLGYRRLPQGNGWRTSPGRDYRAWVYQRWRTRAQACAEVRATFEARDRDVRKAIRWAAQEWDVSAVWLTACAASEGGLDATRIVYGAEPPPTGPDTGWFQFLPGTWAWMSNEAWKATEPSPPPRYRRILSPVGQAYTAAWAFSHGLSYHWFGRGC